MAADRLRIAMFSTMVGGGAGYAALRVHDALRLSGGDSTLYVGQGEKTRHEGVKRLRSAKGGLQPPKVSGHTIFSVDAPGIPDAELDRIIAHYDVFNLHWCARFLSLRNIERLSRSGKPVVITIRDMNPLTGGCHSFHGCENWMQSCERCPQFVFDDLAIPTATLEAKRTLWNFENITIVVLSDHTRQLVKRSPLIGRCHVKTIGNPIDVSIFRPHDRARAREELRIPKNKSVIAYLPSFSSSVKGAGQAKTALMCLADKQTTNDCVVVCAGNLDEALDIPFETINLGYIADKQKLAKFYACADVTLIPSTEETFSNTAAESVACGTPVVGFQVGAIAEIAQGARGCAVPLDDTNALASALNEILSRRPEKADQLHNYVARTFGAKKIGEGYIALFKSLLHRELPPCPTPMTGVLNQIEAENLEELLASFRRRRAADILLEQESKRREPRTFRGQLAFAARGVRLFIRNNVSPLT